MFQMSLIGKPSQVEHSTKLSMSITESRHPCKNVLSSGFRTLSHLSFQDLAFRKVTYVQECILKLINVTVCELNRREVSSVNIDPQSGCGLGSCSVAWQEHGDQHSPRVSPQREVSLSFVIRIGVSVSTTQVTCLTSELLPKLQQIARVQGFFWRRQWHPTPVLLPGKSHGRRSLVGCRLWDRTESDTTSDLAAAAAAGVLLFVFPSLGTRGFCYLSDSPIFAFWSLDIQSLKYIRYDDCNYHSVHRSRGLFIQSPEAGSVLSLQQGKYKTSCLMPSLTWEGITSYMSGREAFHASLLIVVDKSPIGKCKGSVCALGVALKFSSLNLLHKKTNLTAYLFNCSLFSSKVCLSSCLSIWFPWSVTLNFSTFQHTSCVLQQNSRCTMVPSGLQKWSRCGCCPQNASILGNERHMCQKLIKMD